MSEGIRRRSLPPPDAMSDAQAGLDARIRLKQDRGEPLDNEEKAFLADLPAYREFSAEEVRASAARHGGVTPIDAATGLPHDSKRASEQALREGRESALVPPGGKEIEGTRSRRDEPQP